MKTNALISEADTPDHLSAQDQTKINYLIDLLNDQDATIVAHYYTDPIIQALAEQAGGFIGDSLAMAHFGLKHSASTLIVAGVRFMGESAKILSPHKRVLMPTLEATCSLDLSCPIDTFSAYCDQHPDHEVVVYCNTSAAVKARAGWVVTSSNAVTIVDHLDGLGKSILWAPDRYLGQYIQKKLNINMLIWHGTCIVHEEFTLQTLLALKKQYPDAALLVHPESPLDLIPRADVVGSTTQLINAAQTLPHTHFIVATDRGIFYKMQQQAPEKHFIQAPTINQSGTCNACGHCPWMAMNTLDQLEQSLITGDQEITIPANIIRRAQIPLQRMLDFGHGPKR